MNIDNERIIFPDGYEWLIKRNIVGYDAFSKLQPWYYLKRMIAFSPKRNGPMC